MTVAGDDGLARCAWAVGTPDYVAYHDEEWGRPVRGDQALFERLTLEAFQSGLSWITILRKRPAFRKAFDGFDPAHVAAYDEADVARLLADSGIVRNRAKIEAAVTNAGVVMSLEGGPHRPALVLRPRPARTPAPRVPADVPATTAESTAMAKELKRRGFRFVGPTTAYALMQATGMVDDHLADCWRRGAHRALNGCPVGRRGREYGIFDLVTPEIITWLLTALAAIVVVLTRVRLRSQEAAGRLSVASTVSNVHTGAGLLALVLWVAMLVTDNALLGWAALLFWWVTVVAGLLVLVRWMPAKGRHSAEPVADTWSEGPGLSVLAHVGLLVGVVIFTLYLVFDKLPA